MKGAVWTIRTTQDALHALRSLPRHQRLDGYGNERDFAAWLYMEHYKLEKAELHEAIAEYKRSCQEFPMGLVDPEMMRRVQSEQCELSKIRDASNELARLVIRMRQGGWGRRAFEMYGELANSQGTVLSYRSEDFGALLVLSGFMTAARQICVVLPAAWRQACVEELLANADRIPLRLFERLPRHLTRAPMRNVMAPHNVVMCAIAVVHDKEACSLVADLIRRVCAPDGATSQLVHRT